MNEVIHISDTWTGVAKDLEYEKLNYLDLEKNARNATQELNDIKLLNKVVKVENIEYEADFISTSNNINKDTQDSLIRVFNYNFKSILVLGKKINQLENEYLSKRSEFNNLYQKIQANKIKSIESSQFLRRTERDIRYLTTNIKKISQELQKKIQIHNQTIQALAQANPQMQTLLSSSVTYKLNQ